MDLKVFTLNQNRKKTYLDYIEFILAEVTNTSIIHTADTADISDQESIHNRNIRKWTDKKIVDTGVLTHYHKIIDDIFHIDQESILLSKIDNINKFTLYLPLQAIFAQNESASSITSFISNVSSLTQLGMVHEKKKCIVDMKTLRALNKDKQINWSPTVNSLYPIITLADGNCLCHAVLSYLTGMQDTVRFLLLIN